MRIIRWALVLVGLVGLLGSVYIVLTWGTQTAPNSALLGGIEVAFIAFVAWALLTVLSARRAS